MYFAFSGQKWKVKSSQNTEKKILKNKLDITWKDINKDTIWIFPAKKNAIGHIEDSTGNVLTVDGNQVTLKKKELFHRQKWRRDLDVPNLTLPGSSDDIKTPNEFRLSVHDENEDKHLSAPNMEILTGTFQSFQRKFRI